MSVATDDGHVIFHTCERLKVEREEKDRIGYTKVRVSKIQK